MRNADIPSGNCLRRYFAGLTEFVFESRLGIVDPPLIDYLSLLLLRFSSAEQFQRVRALDGRPIQEVADMMAEAQQRKGTARREVHRHIGDMALFYTGVYPETLKQRQKVEKKDFFIDYCSQGKQAYFIASTIETDGQDEAPNDVLERLSEQFEMCSYGLSEVRHEWEHPESDTGPPTLWVQ
jgi:hypothetical protein